jgi:hypothetical protein
MPGRGGVTKNFYLPLARVHVNAERWKDTLGTDYWFSPSLIMATATAGLNTVTAVGGWTLEAEHGVLGSAGDFLGGTLTAGVPGVPGVPTHAALLLTGDIIVSPVIFGGYAHAMAASQMVGKSVRPRKFVVDTFAAFTTASADEPTSGFGMFEDATTTTTATEALQLAFISSNSANFELNTNASTTLTDVGAAVDNLYHIFRQEFLYDTAGVVRCNWYIDGVYQGYIVPTQAEAPWAWGAHTLTANVVKIAWAHLFYDW